jgi:hypothetical protein
VQLRAFIPLAERESPRCCYRFTYTGQRHFAGLGFPDRVVLHLCDHPESGNCGLLVSSSNHGSRRRSPKLRLRRNHRALTCIHRPRSLLIRRAPLRPPGNHHSQKASAGGIKHSRNLKQSRYATSRKYLKNKKETRKMKTGETKSTPSPCLQIFIQSLLEENCDTSANPLVDSFLSEIQSTTISTSKTL